MARGLLELGASEGARPVLRGPGRSNAPRLPDYVIRGQRTRHYQLDPAEFDGGRWWDLDPHGLPATDPHLARFIRKLDAVLMPQTP